MSKLFYFLVSFLVVVALLEYSTKTVSTTIENFVNYRSDGYVNRDQIDEGKYSLRRLEKDLIRYSQEKEYENIEDIPYVKDNKCKICHDNPKPMDNFNSTDYNLSVECECGLKKDKCNSKCGEKKFFQPDFQAKVVSRPEVINTTINNNIPNHLITKVYLTEPKDYEIQPANNMDNEAPSDFKSQHTNLAQFFSKNTNLFEESCITQPYKPYSESWNKMSDCFNNVKYSNQKNNDNFIVTHF